MKITIFAAGSRGDIQPCVVLGRGLQEAGYEVCLAAPEDFAGFAGGHGLDFHPLRGDIQKIMAGEEARRLMDEGSANPLRSIGAFRRMLAPVVRQMAADAYAACQDAEAIVCLAILAGFGQSIAEALRLPLVLIEPAPLLPTRAFPAPSWPIQRDLGGLHNYLSGAAMLQIIWQWYRPFVGEFRQSLGLPAISGRGFHRTLRTTPMVGAYSARIIPRPDDWPESVHISGYLYLDEAAGWQPSPALSAFLEAGAPPVCIGFGSMAGRDAEQLAELALEALAMSGQRGLLLTGWGGLKAGDGRFDRLSRRGFDRLSRRWDEAGNVFVLEAAPHSWLFPRMAAVVHHGGTGTTAEALRAGVPQVIVPFSFDQPFWGRRISELGAGPAPIPHKRLTAGRLARAIQAAVSDPAMGRRARECAEAVRAEDGAAEAVRFIQRCLGGP